MEIKIDGGMPYWLYSALNSLEIYPCSFSKYGTAYQIQKGYISKVNTGNMPDKYVFAC